MNVLMEARQDVADVLGNEGIKAFATDQKSPNSNVVIVEAGAPYVEAGETYGEHTIRFDLAVIGNINTVANCWDKLDALVSDVVLALIKFDLFVESIEQPGILNWGTKAYVATKVTVTGTINFKEGS